MKVERSELGKELVVLENAQLRLKNDMLSWALHKLFKDYDHIGMDTEDFDEWINDLIAQYDERTE